MASTATIDAVINKTLYEDKRGNKVIKIFKAIGLAITAWVNAYKTDRYILVGTAYTADATLSLDDENTIVQMNKASAISLTVPLDSAVAFAIGTKIEVYQLGAGLLTIVAFSGVTIRAPFTLKSLGQYSTLYLTKIGTNTWKLTGDYALS